MSLICLILLFNLWKICFFQWWLFLSVAFLFSVYQLNVNIKKRIFQKYNNKIKQIKDKKWLTTYFYTEFNHFYLFNQYIKWEINENNEPSPVWSRRGYILSSVCLFTCKNNFDFPNQLWPLAGYRLSGEGLWSLSEQANTPLSLHYDNNISVRLPIR